MKSEQETSIVQSTQDKIEKKPNQEILWKYVIILILIHIGGAYGLYVLFTGQCKVLTILWLLLAIVLSGIGITAGAHRLWSHRSYKATWQLRVILMLFQSMAWQNDIYYWARDHRVHHKFTDTNADPHNSKRGLFYSHFGWLVLSKHKDVREKGRTIDLSDIKNDPVVMFQRKYYMILVLLCSFILPALLPWYFFGETLWNSWWVCSILRYAYGLNSILLINSASHAFGYRPYDEDISATENQSIAFMAYGEGWHNYHHVFPWDYKAAELPGYSFNFALGFIDLMARIGWAYDLKTVSQNTISKRISRTGKSVTNQEGKSIWGWNDKEITKDDIASCEILYNKQQNEDHLK